MSGSGPSAAFVREDESPWVFGAVVNNIWSLGGPPGSTDQTNQLLFIPILDYHIAEGWSVGTSPNITADWIAGGVKWTLPLGGGFGSLVRLAGQPIKWTSTPTRMSYAQGGQRHLAAAVHCDLCLSGLGVILYGSAGQRLITAIDGKTPDPDTMGGLMFDPGTITKSAMDTRSPISEARRSR